MHDEEAIHWLASCDPLDGEPDHRLNIVSDCDTVLSGRPGRHLRIGRFRQAHFLGAQEVIGRAAAQYASHQVLVKILVREQPQHCLWLAASASKKASANAGRIEALLDLALRYRVTGQVQKHDVMAAFR